MSKIVYADNAATTFLSKHALDAMMPYLTNQPGNPSSVYSYGRTAKRAVEEARGKVAAAIGAKPEEIYFTAGGTEADNWAAVGYSGIRVALQALKAAGPNPSRDAIRIALSKTKDVPVVVGQAKYSVNADRIPYSGMSVMQVKNGKFVIAP